jgi:hypothetical protein
MRLLRLSAVFLAFYPLLATAQHVELGAFANYTRPDQPHLAQQLFGVGARADVNLIRILQLEVEGAYDFKYPHFETTQLTLSTSELGILHGNAGLKLQTRSGNYFIFVKGGVNQYRLESQVATATAAPVGLSVTRLPEREFTKGILYPGGGIGFHAGLLGIRFDAGDEIYWSSGEAHHSLRLTFGPTFRF